jgi:hypothetical protein
MNVKSTCNAYYNGNIVFYRSGNGKYSIVVMFFSVKFIQRTNSLNPLINYYAGCRNTGEIAAIYDHEWWDIPELAVLI